MMLTVVCFIVCFGTSFSGGANAPTDTFCQTYSQIVTSQVELDAVRRLPRAVRDRIQGNDLDFLCRCLNWKDSTCRDPSLIGQ